MIVSLTDLLSSHVLLPNMQYYVAQTSTADLQSGNVHLAIQEGSAVPQNAVSAVSSPVIIGNILWVFFRLLKTTLEPVPLQQQRKEKSPSAFYTNSKMLKLLQLLPTS